MNAPSDDKIQMAPGDVSVPYWNPFENDKLDRKQAVETLAMIADRVSSPCVITIGGEWGIGKTTILNMTIQHLRSQGFHVAQFNAWETDFAGNPFEALSAELADSLMNSDDKQYQAWARSLLKEAVPMALRLAKFGAPSFAPGSGLAVSFLESIWSIVSRPNPINEYQKLNKSRRAFTSELKRIAGELSELSNGKPLVIAVDELDRCRPSYAIEFLETTKHIFMTPNVIFILAVNSVELEKSIRSLYGPDFDAERYLRRFFNLPIRVPQTNLRAFSDATIQASGLAAGINHPKPELDIPLALLKLFSEGSGASARDVEQGIYQVDLVCQLSDGMTSGWQTCIVLVQILRISAPKVLDDLIRGTASDETVIEAIFGNLPMDTIQAQQVKSTVESTIIAGMAPRPGDRVLAAMMREISPWAEHSPAYVKHQKAKAEAERADDPTLSAPESEELIERASYSESVLQLADAMWDSFGVGDRRPALVASAHLMELLGK